MDYVILIEVILGLIAITYILLKIMDAKPSSQACLNRRENYERRQLLKNKYRK